MKQDLTNPIHYKVYGFESIELLESLFLRMQDQRLIFSIGNALKYVLRCRYKQNVLLDLQKARWHVKRCENFISQTYNAHDASLLFLESYLNKINAIDEDICVLVKAIATLALKADFNAYSHALACLNLEIQETEIKKQAHEEDMQNV